MLKRQQLICSLYALVILTGISLLLSLAAIIYQIIAKFIGFGSQQILEGSCSSYINYKLSNNVRILEISFVGALAEVLFLVPMFTLMLVGLCRIIKANNLAKNTQQLDPVEQIRLSNSKTTQDDDFFTYGKLIVTYILYSLALLCSSVHFGLIANLILSQFQCKHNFYLALLIIGGLSGISVILLVVCWIILQVLRCRIHNYLDKYEVVEQTLQINNVNNYEKQQNKQVNPSNDIENKKPYTLEMQNMNTATPLKTEQTEYMRLNDSILGSYQNTNRNQVQKQNQKNIQTNVQNNPQIQSNIQKDPLLNTQQNLPNNQINIPIAQSNFLRDNPNTQFSMQNDTSNIQNNIPQNPQNTFQVNPQPNIQSIQSNIPKETQTIPYQNITYTSPTLQKDISTIQTNIQTNIPNVQSNPQQNYTNAQSNMPNNIHPNMQTTLQTNISSNNPNIQPNIQRNIESNAQYYAPQTQPIIQNNIQAISSHLQGNTGPQSNIQYTFRNVQSNGAVSKNIEVNPQPNMQYTQPNLQQSTSNIQTSTQQGILNTNNQSNMQPNYSNMQVNTQRTIQANIYQAIPNNQIQNIQPNAQKGIQINQSIINQQYTPIQMQGRKEILIQSPSNVTFKNVNGVKLEMPQKFPSETSNKDTLLDKNYPYANKQALNSHYQQPNSQIYQESYREIQHDNNQPNIQEEIRGSPHNVYRYLDYFMEQNEPFKKFMPKNKEKSFFKSPIRQESDSFQTPVNKYFIKDQKQRNNSYGNDRFVTDQKNLNSNSSPYRPEQPQRSISQKKLNQQQRNYYQSIKSRNYNSILRKDSLVEGNQDEPPREILHKNMSKQFSNQSQTQERYYDKYANEQRPNKKGLLIDYIRSKYT